MAGIPNPPPWVANGELGDASPAALPSAAPGHPLPDAEVAICGRFAVEGGTGEG